MGAPNSLSDRFLGVGHGAARRAWLPIAFVMGSLVLLLVVPLLTNHLMKDIQRTRSEPTNEARALLSQFEGAFAQELVIAAAFPAGSRADSASRHTAIEHELGTETEMDSLVSLIGSPAVEHLAELRSAERAWRALDRLDRSAEILPANRVLRADRGRAVITSAEQLQRVLFDAWQEGHTEADRLDRLSLIATVGLATIALLAALMVRAIGQRVGRFASEADQRARELERSVELRASLIHGIVHDVKNPLGAASGYADLLAEGTGGEISDKQSEMIERIKRLIGTALQTVSELVDLAKVDAAEYKIEPQDTTLAPLIRRIVDDHRAEATKKSIALGFDESKVDGRVYTDPARVRHVVENLISNALKYTPENGRVRVRLLDDPESGGVRISVQDTGPGVPPELRERIFDAFFRVSSSKDRAPGSGIGLSISRRIAGFLGGTIYVTDAPGGGSDFVFVLPRDTPRRRGGEPPSPDAPDHDAETDEHATSRADAA